MPITIYLGQTQKFNNLTFHNYRNDVLQLMIFQLIDYNNQLHVSFWRFFQTITMALVAKSVTFYLLWLLCLTHREKYYKSHLCWLKRYFNRMLVLVVYLDSAFDDIKQNLQEILFLLNKYKKYKNTRTYTTFVPENPITSKSDILLWFHASNKLNLLISVVLNWIN